MSVNYGRIDTNLTLMMYVGKNDKPQVTFGRKSFHGHAASEPHYDCDSCWAYNSSTGILTVRFDYSVLDPLEFAVRGLPPILPVQGQSGQVCQKHERRSSQSLSYRLTPPVGRYFLLLRHRHRRAVP